MPSLFPLSVLAVVYPLPSIRSGSQKVLDKGQSLFSALGTESRASCILGKQTLYHSAIAKAESQPLKKKKKDIFIRSLDDRKLERLHPEAKAKHTSSGGWLPGCEY